VPGGLDEVSRKALTDAVKAVESESSAEVVIAVRQKSASHLHADILVGFVVSYVVLGFMLFSPWSFGVVWIFVDPLLAGAAVALLLAEFPAIRRTLTPSSHRRHAVKAAAHTTFVEHGVGLTRGRTGLLIYISRLERMAEIVPDEGVRRAVDPALWERAVSLLKEAVSRGEKPEALALHIRGLGSVLSKALPHQADDVNEIPDEIVET
jgi:putative membrane protein